MLYFATVPLLLLTGTALAAGLALSGYFVEDNRQRVSMPFFQGLSAMEEKPPLLTIATIRQPRQQPGRDIFSSVIAVPEPKEITTRTDQQLELNEIFLGMTIVKGTQRFCLTNGVLMREGEGNNNFIVKSIEPDGVWYRVGDRDVFLYTGEKIYLDFNRIIDN